MRGKSEQIVRRSGVGVLRPLAFAACLAATYPTFSFAQDVGDVAQSIPAGSQMLLESDVLTYDQDNNTVTASGRVRIEYGGNRMVAERVVYDRKTGRLKALGNVEILEKSGNKIYTQEIDVTDNFADGFVNQLRVETPDKTYFAAESADRKAATVTTFYNGVYTACEPCEEKPNKAPIWRVKSQKIIWNGQKKTIRFERSRFEMFGVPLAMIPAFEIPDPTVKRKSGFLVPSIDYSSEIGIGVHVPYYFALSPTYDLTVTGHGYSKQGFLPEAEWRQRFNNGQYSIKVAGISQMEPEAFDAYTPDHGPAGDLTKLRGMIGTNGHFDINPRWAFGWNLLLQSDKDFSRTYDIGDYKDYIFRNEVYLAGQGERNHFDLRFMKFAVQEVYRDGYPNGLLDANRNLYSDVSRDKKQPWVLPSFDYNAVKDEPVAGGELSINLNSRTILRDEIDQVLRRDTINGGYDTAAIRGAEGVDSRLTGETEWRRSFIAPGGLVLTPILQAQAEARMADRDPSTAEALGNMAGYYGVAADTRTEWYRYMATAGLEAKWPVLFSTSSSTHVLEPTAQIFVRPDEQYIDALGLSNEDAQSFVFDATSLFDRDKFSGYDRMEGGTRANLGIRYSGSFNNGWTTQGLFGQSFHLAGLNSYAAPDMVNVGAESGLETDRSDYVGMVGFSSPGGLSGSLSGRFDEKTFDGRRIEAAARYGGDAFSVSTKYAFIGKQETYGQAEDRHEVTLGGSVKFAQYWRTFGSATYDIKDEYVSRNSLGFGYADECFTFNFTYSQTRTLAAASSGDDYNVNQKFGFNLSFRTLGAFGTSTSPTFAN